MKPWSRLYDSIRLCRLVSLAARTFGARSRQSHSYIRCHRKLPDDACAEINGLMHPVFAAHRLPDDKIPEKLKADLFMPTAFVVVKDRTTISPEFAHIGCCRLTR